MQLLRINKINELTMAKIAQIAFNTVSSKTALTEDEKQLAIRQEIIEMYANLMAREQIEIAEDESRIAWKIGQAN